MCASIPPKYAVASIVGYLKGNFKGHSFCARGYNVSTVGLDEAKIRKYIKDQEENESIEDKYDTDLSNPF